MTSNGDPENQRQQWLKAAVEAAHAGGEVLRQWAGRFTVREKSRANLVTEADEASQTAIISHLQNLFPQHEFLGEEDLPPVSEGSKVTSGTSAGTTDDHGAADQQDQPLWIIDPLDGTTNYVHGLPYYAVSIALFFRRQLQVGVIFDPTRNETFTASAGGGAFLNDAPIRTSGETQVASALAMASLPIAADSSNPAVQRFLKALPRLQAVQRTGSAALNMAYVASGRIDAFWSTSLNPWDVAAGALLVQEAGGTVTGLTGESVDIFIPNLLAASSRSLQHELSHVLA